MKVKAWTICFFIILFLFGGCSINNIYYKTGQLDQEMILDELFTLLGQVDFKGTNAEEDVKYQRFTIIDKISEIFTKTGSPYKNITFLTQYVEIHPEDPYNSYYLTKVADTYQNLSAYPMAVHYYDRVLKNYPDMLITGSSIHYNCLVELLKYEVNPEAKIEYYKEILSRYEKNIDKGIYYYYLAYSYEQVGLWDQSIQTYKQFLAYPETQIPGKPGIHNEIKQKIAFYDVEKDWAVEDLQTLVYYIKTAIQKKDVALLNRYKAKFNFFSAMWDQKAYDPTLSERYFDIGSWLLRSSVRYSNELEGESNDYEAYLRTWGWAYWINTWYFYFRRINFPEDPEIDGRWEWVGVYFGEKN